ncbi:MAG: hypothetical protein QHH02_09375, partial [Syntrophomonadaceae bacterium]|nr:hypothetical protein [Syntrophomonadaceae bacterium]
LFLGGLIAVAGLRAARENARRREVQQKNRQYFSEKITKVEEDIRKVEAALADYRSFSQKLWPIALGIDQGSWDDVSRGLQEVNREKRVRQQLHYLDQEVAALYREADVSTEEEFRRKAERYQETQSLLARIKQQEEILAVVGGNGEALERPEKELSRLDEVIGEEERKRLELALSELNLQLKKTGEELGSTRDQIKELEQNLDLAGKLLQREMKLNSLNSMAERWQARCLCRKLIELAKENHERNRQPAVLRRASEFFSTMTNHRYSSIIATAGSGEQLEVMNGEGVRVPISNLSRGTASQLYLSVRLALAQNYQVIRLPIMLDEVLVDFDLKRLNGALKVLRRIAEERQVLYFTCHRHLIEAATKCFDEYYLVEIEEGVKVRTEVIKGEAERA